MAFDAWFEFFWLTAAADLQRELFAREDVVRAADRAANLMNQMHLRSAEARVRNIDPPVDPTQAAQIRQLLAAPDDKWMREYARKQLSSGRLFKRFRPDGYVAQKSTMVALVGCAWINLPEHIPLASSAQSIASYLNDGVPLDKGAEIAGALYQVYRAQDAFLVSQKALGREHPLYCSNGLPSSLALESAVERAIRHVWSKIERATLASTDGADIARSMADSLNLFVEIDHGLSERPRPRNAAAVAAIKDARASNANDHLAMLNQKLTQARALYAERTSSSVSVSSPN